MKRWRVVTLLARHGSERYRDAASDIRSLFARQFSDVSHDLLVIDNALDTGWKYTIAPEIRLIGGSNTAWEFSAWDSGIDELGSQLDAYDAVNLATSAFRQLNSEFLATFDTDVLDHIAGQNTAIGHMDFYNEEVEAFGTALQMWLRSSFILLSPARLRRLGSLVSVTDRAALFSGDPAAPFLPQAAISSNYQRYILDWLTGDGTGQGFIWHSRFGLTRETLTTFENKCLAIINEQLLTYRLMAQGDDVVDITWLRRRIDTCASNQRAPFPDWRAQISGR